MLKRGFFFVSLSLLLVLLSHAVFADFDVDVNAVETDVSPSGQAVFEVKILNKEARQDTFTLSVPDVSWSILSEPLSDYFSGMNIDAYSSKTTTLKVSPASGLNFGTYKTALKIKSSKTGISRTEYLTINLVPPTPVIRDYLAAVSRIVEIPSKIDPRQEFEIKINLINRNPKNLSDLLIKIRTKNDLFSRDVRIDLAPLGKEIVRESFDLDDLTIPQEDLLVVSLIVDGKVLQPEIEEKFEIIGYSGVIEKESQVKRSFLKTVKEITYFNDGNVKAMQTLESDINPFRKIFTKTWPGSFTITKEGKRYMAWQLSIEPQQTMTVKIRESYRGLFFFCIIAIIAGIAYYLFRSPVAIRKEASVIGLREGGISELRVLLHIKNRSKKPFEKVTVIDRVPKIATLEKSFEAGTLQPSKTFQHDKQGTVIKWEIDSLDRYDERIMSYRIKSKLSILGAFNLPAAIVRFHDPEGKKFITKSNKSKITI